MATIKRRSALPVIVLLLAAFGLGGATRQLLIDVDLDRPTPIPVDPVTVRITSSHQVLETRQRLIQYVFGHPGLPRDLPADRRDGTYTVHMQNGLESLVRLLRPARPNGRLALYHAGHAAYGTADQPMVDALLANGYTTLLFDMPLIGVNAAPLAIELPNGPVTVSRHDHLAFLDPVTVGSPIRYFLEPVVVMLNQYDQKFDDITMIGVSGGAWTTTLAAAIDPRIDRSYPAAGTLPLAVRFAREESWGDWEQTEPSLYAIAAYEDLYALGAHEGRQLQILNEHDPCCFGGDYRSIYLPQVQAAVKRAGGGSFDVLLDTENREHSIGRNAIDAILSDMDNTPAN